MTRAVILMLIGMSFIPAGDAASKILTSELGVAPLFVSWSRFAIGAVLLIPFMFGQSMNVFRDPWTWVRGGLIACGISSITIALQTTDLATAFGGLFFAPIVSFVTAAVFLREPVTPTRTALVVMGFIGVLLVAQPGLNFTAGTGFSLLAGVFYGTFLTVSRHVAPNHKPLHLVFSQLAIAAVLVAPFGLMNLPTPSAPVVAQVLMSAIFSMTGNMLLIMAYALAPATRLAPLIYFQLVAALMFGWLIFGTWPNALAVLGLVVIAGSGFATFVLKR